VKSGQHSARSGETVVSGYMLSFGV